VKLKHCMLDQLIELFGDLFQHLVVAGHNNGDARHARVFSLADRQAVYIKAAPAEQAGNPRQDTETVLNQN